MMCKTPYDSKLVLRGCCSVFMYASQERQMDTMDVSDTHSERKILDLQRRYDDQYDKIAEAE